MKHMLKLLFVVAAGVASLLGYGELARAQEQIRIGVLQPMTGPATKNGTENFTAMQIARDMINVAVGIVWQLCLTALPIYLVLQHWSWVAGIATTLVVTTVIIKFNWYDKLEKA